jgi:DNA polymerase-1
MLAKRCIWQNGKFDVRFLRHQWNVDAPLHDDTMLMHYALDERQGVHSLKTMARERFDAPFYEQDIKQYLPSKKTPYSAIPEPVRWKYLSYDVYYTAKLAVQLREEMVRDNVQHLYEAQLMPAANAFAKAEMRGVAVDLKHHEKLATELGVELDRKIARIGTLSNTTAHPVSNPRAYKQLTDWMFDGLQAPKFEGARTTKEDALLFFLSRYPDADHPIRQASEAILDFRETQALIGTFVNGLPANIYPDGRVHPDVLLHGSITGRTPIHNPPLQTAPRTAKVIKKLFVPSPGYVIGDFDYDQLEIRTAAWESGDQEMIRAFSEPLSIEVHAGAALPEIVMRERFPMPIQILTLGQREVHNFKPDFHTRGAALAYNQPWWTLSEDDRYNYKFIIFGVLYGRGAKSLATDRNGLRGVSIRQAEAYIERLWESFPTLRKFIDDNCSLVREVGELQTAYGRKRRFPFITRDTWWKMKKQIANFPVQSMASDICMEAFVRLMDALPARGWGYPLFTVHDSIVFELAEATVPDAVELIKDVMSHPSLEDRGVPWEVEGKVGPSWGETKLI